MPRAVPAANLTLMRQIDELHLDYPFAGRQMLRRLLAIESRHAGQLHVVTRMKWMKAEALDRKPNPSKPEPIQ